MHFWQHTHKVNEIFSFLHIVYISSELHDTELDLKNPLEMFWIFFENLETEVLAKFLFVKFKSIFYWDLLEKIYFVYLTVISMYYLDTIKPDGACLVWIKMAWHLA